MVGEHHPSSIASSTGALLHWRAPIFISIDRGLGLWCNCTLARHWTWTLKVRKPASGFALLIMGSDDDALMRLVFVSSYHPDWSTDLYCCIDLLQPHDDDAIRVLADG